MSSPETVVLIVDDEELIRENLELFFEDEGYLVLSAFDAESALSLLSQRNIDVGIIDIRLPEMNGEELIIKAHAVQPEMRFVVHTGSMNYSLPRRLSEIGMTEDDIFIKPVQDMTQLMEAVRRLSQKKSV